MPIKKMYETEKGVYRKEAKYGSRDWFDDDPDDRLRQFTDKFAYVSGVAVKENPASPTAYEILVWVAFWTRWGQGAESGVFRFKAVDGSFIGRDMRGGPMNIYTLDKARNGADGKVYGVLMGGGITQDDYLTCNLDTMAWTSVDYPDPAGDWSYKKGAWAIDSERNLYLAVRSTSGILPDPHLRRGQIAVVELGTNQLVRKIDLVGDIEAIFTADNRVAYAVSQEGVATVFDYTTGQILGVMHFGTSPYKRHWSWDRVTKRILCVEETPDLLPEGSCTLRVLGYYAQPLPVGVTSPIPLAPARAGERVTVYTRAYGGAGEGITGVGVNFSTSNPAVGTLQPERQASDNNGVSLTYLNCLDDGPLDLTMFAEVPDA